MATDFETPPSPGGLGTANNDTITGGVGDDSIDGGGGIDTISYTGTISDYTISCNADGTSTVNGTALTDQLTNVEKLKFADGEIQIAANLTSKTPDGTATHSLAQFTDAMGLRLQKFFLAYYGRAADYSGLVYWKDTLANGLGGDQLQMVGHFGNDQQSEFVSLYGSSNDTTTFLNAIYQNLFSHAADATGRDYWLGVINDSVANGTPLQTARANAVIYIVDGAQADDAAILNAKITGMTTISQQIATYDQSNTFGGSSGASALAVARAWTQGQVAGAAPPNLILQAVTEKAIATAPVGGNEVQTSVSYTLPTGFVNLKLTGSTAITGAGNSADNLIYGNSAGSTLTGGGGNDCFIIAALPTSSTDRVTDFSAGIDVIAVDTASFTGLTAGQQTVQTYGHETGTTATLVYAQATGTLYYDANTAGVHSPQAILTLVGAPTLTANSVWAI